MCFMVFHLFHGTPLRHKIKLEVFKTSQVNVLLVPKALLLISVV